MAETAKPLTTEDYTHEEAIARIEELEASVCDALELLAKGDTDGASVLLEAVLAEEEPDDEDDDEDDEDDGPEEDDDF